MKVTKPQKMDPKNVFFSKFPQDFELLKQVPESLHQTIYFGRTRVGQSVELALITLAAIFFWLLARILTIFDKKYRILTCRDKRESYLNVLQQNNV